MSYIAHIRSSDGKVQTVREHLLGVERLSGYFGDKIGVGNVASIAGLLHDVGKNSPAFRDYILEAVQNPNHPPKRGSVDHSTAGGKLLYEKFHNDDQPISRQLIAEILGNVIISHHSGLQDFLSPDLSSDYLRRVKEKVIDDFRGMVEEFYTSTSSYKALEQKMKSSENELIDVIKRNPQSQRLTLMFLTKYIFSCLIDADRTDSRYFEENTAMNTPHDNPKLFEQYHSKLTEYLNKLSANKHSQSKINQLRADMSQQCEDFARNPSGIYTLSIPTGGGKTLASLRYALKHSLTFGKERIIYVVPYTTIIEQNAQEVRRILEDDVNILEHHSNVVTEEESTGDYRYAKDKPLTLAKDNWESPIIFTTMVQFLNTIYSNSTRNSRRMHNLANSVIIFDEVQSLPIKCTSLLNEALNFLNKVCRSSILLCTATQPALDFVEEKVDSIDGEVIQNLDEISGAFKRVEAVDRTNSKGWGTEDLSQFILDQMEVNPNILIILNTKTVVRKLFNQLKEDDPDLLIYHLSTSMCAAHRQNTLEKVKHCLEKGEKVVCLSTQLIEAGVDISFDCVIRSLAGLDSIAQAMGRCNRHGKHDLRYTYIINHNEENLNHLKTIKIGAEITGKMLRDQMYIQYTEGLLSPKMIRFYFENFYRELENELDYYVPSLDNYIFHLLSQNEKYMKAYVHKKGEKLPLQLHTSTKTAGKYFNVIDQQTTSVLVPYEGEGKEIIAELNGDPSIEEMSALLKKVQPYMVNVYDHELNELSKQQSVVHLWEGRILALQENAYDREFGVTIAEEGKMDPHFI
ncbi:CRISPR-associated helicase Cas3' [Halobacillus amylolyticus]|uniref:CRISPR-associated helicase Cas3 n=1 Tax=Halobacillus amylolyticus TaxID=2932259 RepID=A0ABY4HGR9_9BACI|nr:CRISPR-associated helicase Cas3' [Halobacillus amylolyticus]UOR13572.1 CRISPR-associated helicase Cas3' [Halobacillus amylolyticus]